MIRRSSRFLNQQKIVVGIIAIVIIGILGYFFSMVVTEQTSGEFIEGEHYVLLDNPRRIRGDKIEIMEFFSYGCVHCYNFDPELESWVEKNADKIRFVRTPAVVNESWRLLGGVYYTFREMDLLDALHSRFFDQIHRGNRVFTNIELIADWVESQDVDRELFLSTFNSPRVKNQVALADQLSRRARIASVPGLIVDGKYAIKATSKVGTSRMLDVMDHLIASKDKATPPATSPEQDSGPG
jgi:thiol:disulfide interchange protein DsbA